MTSRIKTDICIIGAGSGGLSLAAAAVQMGASVTLIEKGKMGGDCLNTGCVPSKSLLAAAHKAQNARKAAPFGIDIPSFSIDYKRVHRYVHEVIAGIAPHDSVERFQSLGVKVIQAHGRFLSPKEVEAGQYRIQARRFVIATGSRAFIPPIPGLETIPYLTNETIFDQTECPRHLLIIGGGPIGMEMAQAYRRLGADVTIVENAGILAKDDPALVAVVRSCLSQEGVNIRDHTQVTRIERLNNPDSESIRLHIKDKAGSQTVEGTHLLVATGRQANIEDLGLDNAGVDLTPRGIQVDDRLRTTNRKIFAIGDCNGGFQFTHMAAYQAGIVIRNILFRLPAKQKTSTIPWVTYTDPELAHVGLNEAQAKKKYGQVTILERPWAESDRARAEGQTEGCIKLITTSKGRLLGASIVGAKAGEQIQTWCLALSAGLKLGIIAGTIFPYPTRGESHKLIAGSFFTPKLFSPLTRRLVRFLLRFG